MLEITTIDSRNDSAEYDRRAISQTLDRGLAVVDLIAASSTGLTISEISEALSSHRTNIVRLLNTLVQRGYVSRKDSGRYILGSRLLELGRLIDPIVRAVAQPILQSLADETGATAHLTVAEGADAVALLVIEPRTGTYHVAYRAGTKRPLTRGASGFAILSARPPAIAELPEVAQARKRGWAESSGQIEYGTWGVAAPILHPQYPDLSVGLVLLRKPDRAHAEAVLSTAKRIREALG